MYLAGLERTMRDAPKWPPPRDRVARQIDGIGGDRRLAKIIDDFAFARNDLQRRLKILSSSMLISFPAVSPEPCFLASLFGFAFFFFLPPSLPRADECQSFSWQVHHVADGRFDGVVPPQIFVNVFAFAGIRQ